MVEDLTPCSDVSPQSEKDNVRAFLESLTGPSRGRVAWVSSDRLRIAIDTDRMLRVVSDDGETHSANDRARLLWSGETYEIEALPDTDIWVNGRKVGSAHCVAAPSALIGASNFFELAVAVAISLFGMKSGAALATVVGVLVEVPVMLSVVAIVNKSKTWYERHPAVQKNNR